MPIDLLGYGQDASKWIEENLTGKVTGPYDKGAGSLPARTEEELAAELEQQRLLQEEIQRLVDEGVHFNLAPAQAEQNLMDERLKRLQDPRLQPRVPG